MKPSDAGSGVETGPLAGLKSVAELGYTGDPAPKAGMKGMDAYRQTLGLDQEEAAADDDPAQGGDPGDEIPDAPRKQSAKKPGKDPESPGTGKDPESAGEAREASAEADAEDDDSVLQEILEKFQGKPESPSRRVRKLLNGQGENPELKAALEQLEELEGVADRLLLKGDDGWDVRPEHAGRALAAQRKPGIPTEKQIRGAIEGEMRKALAETVADDSLDEVIAAQKPLIDRQVAQALQAAQTQAQSAEIAEQIEVGRILRSHLDKHKADEDLLPEMDRLFARMPNDLRGRAVVEGWFGGNPARLFKMLRMEQNMSKALREAYDAGKKAKGAPTPTEVGERGSAGGSPRRGKAASGSFDEGEFKKGIRQAGKVHIAGNFFPSFSDLMARK